MEKQIAQLLAFQQAFKSTVNTQPTLLTEEQWKLRLALSQEELEEYEEACQNNDIVEIFDSILDRLFLAFGDAVSHGLQDYLVAGFEEVLASNMSKLDDNDEPIVNGQNGVLDNTRPLGKLLKSNNFFQPRLDLILKNRKMLNRIKFWVFEVLPLLCVLALEVACLIWLIVKILK